MQVPRSALAWARAPLHRALGRALIVLPRPADPPFGQVGIYSKKERGLNKGVTGTDKRQVFNKETRCVLYVRGRPPPKLYSTRGCLGLRPSLRLFFYDWNADKKPSAKDEPERPTPPPTHVVCGDLW